MTALHRAYQAYPRGFWVLWWGTLINRLGEFVVPLLGFYLTASAKLSVGEVSVILSMLGLGRFVAEGLSGSLTDRRGARFTMIVALVGGAAMTLALSFATSFIQLVLGVLGFSLLSALYKPAASTAVADLTQGTQRTQAYTLLYWAINVGAATAPVLGGWLAGVSFRLLFWLDAATMAAYALLLALFYPKTARPTRAQAQRRTLFPHDPLLWWFCLASLLFGLTYQSYKLLAVVFAQQGFTPLQYGQVLAVNGALVVVLGLPLGHLISRSNHPRWQSVGAALLGIGFLGHAWAQTLIDHMLAVVVWTVGEIVAYSISKTVISELGPMTLRGTYIGLVGSMSGLASLMAPLIGGALLTSVGSTPMWLAVSALAFAAAVLLLILEEPIVNRRTARSE
ncbi:MFS transporter [Deinococcus sp. QL22]|uniref:MFS transporter n=1 Tax=Deinococcus sp. QL22 TaxID=2939437 RepID=UPI002016DB8D|nr:MFS transporter [Deinococcus sp. QL22]UQN08227.1 MFS transporter [Deinococcus sp. QL22]